MRLMGRVGLRHVAGAAAISLAPLAMGATPAVAADATVTVVHGIPATPVDVYVDGAAAIPNFQYETVTTTSLPEGEHTLEIRPAGADPATAPILSANADLASGGNYSVVAHLTEAGQPGLNLFPNPTSRTPEGQAGVTVRHTAAAPAVDVRAGGQVIVPGLTNPNEASLFVPAGTVSADVVLAGTSTVAIGPASLNLAAGTRYIVYAVGNADAGYTLLTQTYEVGTSSSAPPHSVPSGDGSSAGTVPWAAVALVGLGLTVAVVSSTPALRRRGSVS
jgi:Domain of unknown function (DUF4397)